MKPVTAIPILCAALSLGGCTTTGAAPVAAPAPPPLAPAPQAAGLDLPADDFSRCVGELRARAGSRGIPAPLIEAAFRGVRPNPRVVELDRKQPEFVQTFGDYLDKRLSAARIARGRALLAQHRPLFREIEDRYGVPARYLVALWGLESNFGENMGSFPVVESLTTLACEGRRGEFFAGELMNALRIAADGNVPIDRMEGSWAGALGQPQFMPSTFLRHAVDADGDGRRDIWASLPDVFASAASYLRAAGWRPGEDWGQEVMLPRDFDYALAAPDVSMPVGEWRRRGVTAVPGGSLADDGQYASLVLPAGWRGPAFLTYPNFDAILDWNRSTSYALTVGLLADRIAGKAPLHRPPPPGETPLARSQVIEMQTWLTSLGFDAGAPDGIIGPKTRSAIRDFQLKSGLPADGYPDQGLFSRLQQAAGAS